MLSWVPHLDGGLLEKVCTKPQSADRTFADELNNLILGCLVEAHGHALSISGAVRSMFRRRFGFGPEELLHTLADQLRQTLNDENAKGALRSEVIDAIIFIYALEGQTLPDAFRKLLLPSTLEALVRDAYNSGRENPASYDTAIKWGLASENMKMDEGIREEILGTVARAYIRQEDFNKANELLLKIEKKGYRSRFFLRGSWFAIDGEPSKAIPLLEHATRERRYRTSAINQLGICYFRTGEWAKLNSLVNVDDPSITRSAFLMDLKAQFLTASGDYDAAERTIEQLSRLPEDDNRSQKRRAMLLAKRDKNFDESIKILTRLIEGGNGRYLDLRFVRGIIAAKAGKEIIAREDASYVRAHARRFPEDQAAKIELRIALKRGNWRLADEIFSKIKKQGFAEELLRAEILESKSRDGDLPMSERNGAHQECQQILIRHKNHSDLDFVES